MTRRKTPVVVPTTPSIEIKVNKVTKYEHQGDEFDTVKELEEHLVCHSFDQFQNGEVNLQGLIATLQVVEATCLNLK
jgi:hypothetical protein